MRIVQYARVSTVDKDQDPNIQLGILDDISRKRGYEVIGKFVDYASGRDPNRPQWSRIMELVSKGKVDGILAVRLDRIMRSSEHLYAVLSILNRSKNAHNTVGVSLLFSDFNFNPQDPQSKLMFAMLSAIAEFERDITSIRIKEGLEERRSQGIALGRPSVSIPVHKCALMRCKGESWRDISEALDIPLSTLYGHKDEIITEIERILNPPTSEILQES